MDRHELYPLTASPTGCRAVGRRACGRRRTVGVCRAVIFGGQAVGPSGDELALAGRRTIESSDRTDGDFARRELRRVLFGKEEGSHRLVRPFLLFCGKKGIRTPETLLGFTRFPGGPVQPLLHLSGFEGKNRQTFPILQMPPPFFRRGGAAAEGIVRIGRCRLRADAKKSPHGAGLRCGCAGGVRT